MSRQCRSKVELIQLGSAHEKYGVWTRPNFLNFIKTIRKLVLSPNCHQYSVDEMSEVITICWNSYVNVNINKSIPPHMLHSARLEITWNKYPGSWGPHLSLAKKWYRGRAKAHSRFALVWKAANITTHSVIISESMALEWHTAELLMTPWSFSL